MNGSSSHYSINDEVKASHTPYIYINNSNCNLFLCRVYLFQLIRSWNILLYRFHYGLFDNEKNVRFINYGQFLDRTVLISILRIVGILLLHLFRVKNFKDQHNSGRILFVTHELCCGL